MKRIILFLLVAKVTLLLNRSAALSLYDVTRDGHERIVRLPERF